MEIREIQEWEKDFAKRKGLLPKNKNDAAKALNLSFLKLSEEVGELAESILRKKYDEIPAEASDVIIFACKIAKIVEDYYGQPCLTEVLKKKIEYAEKREYDKKTKDMTKPGGGFKKYKGQLVMSRISTCFASQNQEN